MGLQEQLDQSYVSSFDGMDIPWLLAEWADRQPDKAALIWCPFNGESTTWSYAELFDSARCFAAGMRQRGVNSGDFVLIHMDNSPEFIISWYACAMLGAVAVSTNTRSVARDMAYFEDVTAAACCLTQPQYAGLIRESCTQLKFIAVTETDAGEIKGDSTEVIKSIDGIAFDEVYADEPIDLPSAEPLRNLSVQFTSGTTSRPKAVLWTHANALYTGRATAQRMRLFEDDVTLIYLPLFHTNAQAYSMLSTHWSGGTVVVQPKFSASRYWDVVMRHKVTWGSMIPFAVKAILDQPIPEHRMRAWLFGARVPAIEEMFGVITLGHYGMTELLGLGTAADYNHLGPELTIGRVSPDYQVQIRRDDGTLCEPGEKGKLFVRGTRGVTVFKEYYGNPEANASSFDENGWFDTGDILRIDDQGWLYFSDRDKDMLKIGAENVAASEIESVVMETGLVSECAVVGQKHYMLDEVPVVFVIPGPSGQQINEAALAQQIIAHCEVNLPDFKVVRSVHVVDSLPRSMLEKIAKNQLRERLEPITEGR